MAHENWHGHQYISRCVLGNWGGAVQPVCTITSSSWRPRHGGVKHLSGQLPLREGTHLASWENTWVTTWKVLDSWRCTTFEENEAVVVATKIDEGWLGIETTVLHSEKHFYIRCLIATHSIYLTIHAFLDKHFLSIYNFWIYGAYVH